MDTAHDDGGPHYIVDELIETETLTCILGASKSGKSLFSMQMAFCVQNGIPFLGMECQKKDVLYVDLELKESVIKRRYDSLAKQYSDIGKPEPFQLLSLRDELCTRIVTLDEIIKTIREVMSENPQLSMVIIDDYYMLPGGIVSTAATTLPTLLHLAGLSKINKAAVCYVHHTNSKETEDIMGTASGSCVHARFADNFIHIHSYEGGIAGFGSEIAAKLRAGKTMKFRCSRSEETGFFEEFPEMTDEELLEDAIDKEISTGKDNERTLCKKFGVTVQKIRDLGYKVDTKTHTVSKPEEPNPEEPVTIKQVPTKAEASDKKKPVLSVVNGGKKY